MNSLQKEQAEFSVSNSSLSEYGVLGFEYGTPETGTAARELA